MVQVKKDAVRNRILETADRLFQKSSYIAATMSQIAKEAELASSTIYVYFPSKLDVALSIFEPWIIAQLDETEARALTVSDNRKRLEYVLTRLWRDIPLENNNYFNNLMQALAISTIDDNYKPTILLALKERVSAMIQSCLPPQRAEQFDTASFTHLAVMAFDGFVINGHLNPDSVGNARLIASTCDMILGPSTPQP